MFMRWIDDIILGLTDIYDTRDIYELLDFLKIKVIKLDKNNILLQNNESLYHRYYFENEIIFIKTDLPINYEKFLLSHELAHAILHTSILSSALNNTLINTGKLEKEANYFAFKLGNLRLDEFELINLTIEQIASSLELPYEPLKQLVNL